MMTQRSSRLIGGVLLVALLTVTAGCAAAIGGDPDPETIAEQLDDRHDEIDDIQGVQVTTIETPESTDRTVTEVVERPPAESRHEVIESDSEWQSAGDIVVTTDEQIRSYNAAENTIAEFEFDQTPEQAAFATEELIAEALNDSDISYEGTDTVADRDVYVITLTDDDTDQTTTIWADQEFWYPLKYETSFEQGDHHLTTTMTYEEVAFNEGVDDEALAFDPPADATVEEFERPETNAVDSVAAANEETGYEVIEPELPERFAFDTAQIIEIDDSTTTMITYESDDKRVQYTVTDNTEHEPTGESVDIGDTEGTVSAFGDQTSVAWDCDGVRYSLGGELDRDTLLDSAASVGC